MSDIVPTYHAKLVRDNTPQLIEQVGGMHETRKLPERARRAHLLRKLREETNELIGSPDTDFVEEAADVVEVLRALATMYGVAWRDVTARGREKYESHGGYDLLLFLLWSAGGDLPHASRPISK